MTGVDDFWTRFVAATGIDGPHTTWAFGDSPQMQTELGLLVRDGPKRATAGPVEEPLPQPGDLSVILDGSGDPLCVIRTTEVEVRPFGEVDERFAWDEGEGDRSLDDWRREHLRFFASLGTPADMHTPVVLERFELLWSG
jgi:uncharacterized protein YhfF